MRELTSEVLVIGAGPAGLHAAKAAAEAGARVLLIDENPSPGGQIWRSEIGRGPAGRKRELLAALQHQGVRLLVGVSVFSAATAHCLQALDERGDVLTLKASKLILATGATELFLPFPGWTLPGVCGAGGLQALVKGGLPIQGKRVVVAGSGPLLLAVGAFLRSRGANVLGIFEQASVESLRRFTRQLWRHPGKLLQGLGLLARIGPARLHLNAWPKQAFGTERLERLLLAVGGRELSLECDYLACGFGLVPATGLARLLGCAVEGGSVVVDAQQRTSVRDVFCAGESTGIGGLEVARVEGTIAGLIAASSSERARALLGERTRERRFAEALREAYALRQELRALPRDSTIVCRCEDVTYGSLRSHGEVRQAKLQTRAGMGLCQGRVCNPALEFLCGFGRDRVRPPLFPVPMGALANARSRLEPEAFSPFSQDQLK